MQVIKLHKPVTLTSSFRIKSNGSFGTIPAKSNKMEQPTMELTSSTSPKFGANIVESPILTLPADILAKIIAFIPTAQWPSLDLLKDFHDATRIAWRGLRNINLDRDFFMKPDRSSFDKAVGYLVDRSPFLTSLSGIDLRVEPDSDVIYWLAKFEHLQSITMGNAQLFGEKVFEDRGYGPPRQFDRPGGVRLDALVEFLESTRSRTSLKQLQLFNVERNYNCECGPADLHAGILDRFHSSLVIAREFGCFEWTQTRRPFKLEKFAFSTSDSSLFIRLDTLDASCLTDLRLGKTNFLRMIEYETKNRPAARVEPLQLANLIDRAENLRRIELSFLQCEYDRRQPLGGDPCRQQLGGNRELLAALARHKHLTTIKFDIAMSNFGGHVGRQQSSGYPHCGCLRFGPEFIEMLKSIGRRGQLQKLISSEHFWCIDENGLGATIHEYIPYLRSIKLCIRDVKPDIISNIVSLTELEEVHLFDSEDDRNMNSRHTALDANAIIKISQLSNLKRLAIPGFYGREMYFDQQNRSFISNLNLLEPLAEVKTLVDLRIRYAHNISTNVFEKWSEGFGSNLQILMLGGRCQVSPRGTDHDDGGLIRLLKKAVQLRILILHADERMMFAIAKSCPQLEVFGVHSGCNKETIRGLQEIVDRCTMLRQLGGISSKVRSKLEIPKYRKIGNVNVEFGHYDFDDPYYE